MVRLHTEPFLSTIAKPTLIDGVRDRRVVDEKNLRQVRFNDCKIFDISAVMLRARLWCSIFELKRETAERGNELVCPSSFHAFSQRPKP